MDSKEGRVIKGFCDRVFVRAKISVRRKQSKPPVQTGDFVTRPAATHAGIEWA